MKSQNPDGGWSAVPFYSLKHTLPYTFLASHFRLIRNIVRRQGTNLLWLPLFDSAIDMTSRVLIALGNTRRNDERKRKAISRGVQYLMSQYDNGRFHSDARWVDSDVHETSLSIIALKPNDVASEVRGGALDWLLRQHNMSEDEIAHLIWAGCTAEVPSQTPMPYIERLVSLQNKDGSWHPTLPFRMTAPFWDPLFSTAMPLLALKKANTRN